MSENELKPCPFCGGEAFYIKIMGNYDKPHEIFCSKCDGAITEGRSEKQVVTNWNIRPIEDDLRKRIAELREDNATLGDSNAWIKQNYEDLERDYGVMHEKMCARIAELEEENDRLQDAWFKDETICPDGSLKPKVSTLLSRIAELTECIGSQMADVYTLKARIAELEEKQRWIPVSERLPDTKIVYDKFDVIVELVDIVNGEMIRHVDLLSYDYRNKSWNDDCGEFGFYPVTGVTHWRERPTPPEVQE